MQLNIMERQPTNQLNIAKKEAIDAELKKRLRDPTLRRAFRARVDACQLLEDMRSVVSVRAAQEIQQDQQNKGKEHAAGKFLDEVTRYSCWGVHLLDALYHSGLLDLATKIYPEYLPPRDFSGPGGSHSFDDNDDGGDGGSTGRPPPYSPRHIKEQSSSATRFQPVDVIVVRDCREELANLESEMRQTSPVYAPHVSADQAVLSHADVSSAHHPGSDPATRGDSPVVMSTVADHALTARQEELTGCREEPVRTQNGERLNNLEGNEGVQSQNTVSVNAPESRPPDSTTRSRKSATKLDKERELNFVDDPSTYATMSETTASVDQSSDHQMRRKDTSSAKQNVDDTQEYLHTQEFCYESRRETTNYLDVARSLSTEADPSTTQSNAEPAIVVEAQAPEARDRKSETGAAPRGDNGDEVDREEGEGSICVSETRVPNSDDSFSDESDSSDSGGGNEGQGSAPDAALVAVEQTDDLPDQRELADSVNGGEVGSGENVQGRAEDLTPGRVGESDTNTSRSAQLQGDFQRAETAGGVEADEPSEGDLPEQPGTTDATVTSVETNSLVPQNANSEILNSISADGSCLPDTADAARDIFSNAQHSTLNTMPSTSVPGEGHANLNNGTTTNVSPLNHHEGSQRSGGNGGFISWSRKLALYFVTLDDKFLQT